MNKRSKQIKAKHRRQKKNKLRERRADRKKWSSNRIGIAYAFKTAPRSLGEMKVDPRLLLIPKLIGETISEHFYEGET